MDFALSDDQTLVRESARTLLAKECPPSLVRAVAVDRSAADGLWRHLIGWLPLADGPLVDLCLFLEECGAVVAPTPFFATAALYAPLARAAGIEWDGVTSGTVAVAGADGVWRPNDDATKTFVLDADCVAQTLVVRGDGSVAPASSSGVAACRRMETIDASRAVFAVEAAPDGPWVDVSAAVDGWLERATVALAAEMVGTARSLLAATVQYAKDRVQFDRPIGSFQAVQHKLADVALTYERAWSAVYYAAMCIDADDPDRHRATHVAKAAAGAAATRAAKDGIQIHGGIGYTWEHDLHLFIRRAYASEHFLGTTPWHHDRLADLLLP